MEKRAFLAVVLSLLILIVYQEWLARQYSPPPSSEGPSVETVKPQEPAAKDQSRSVVTQAATLPVEKGTREIRVETDRYVGIFTNKGARLKSFTLKQYRTSAEEKSPPVEVVSHDREVPYPLGIQFADSSEDAELVYSVQGSDLSLNGDAKGTLIFQGRTPTGLTISKEFTFTASSYTIGMNVAVTGSQGNSGYSVLVPSQTKGPTNDSVFEGFLGFIGNKLIREPAPEPNGRKEFAGEISWAGFGYTYFLLALLPEPAREGKAIVRQNGAFIVMEMAPSPGPAGEQKLYSLFVGPKDLDVLKSLQRGLERSIDFGYFWFISIPLLYLMRFSNQFTGSYGLDIILLTVLMKLVTAPLTHKSFVSMKQMQKLQPQMARLQEKFKDDREKLNKEIMELYRRNKVNPLGGCLPMVLQIPIFIGLYNALLTPIELRHAPFMWIKDLSRPDWESLPLTVAGWSFGVPILTLLMGASMFIQQWMTPSAGDPNQRRMMLLMPIVFTAMFINFPSGLTIYWLVNNILSIGQQYMVNRMSR